MFICSLLTSRGFVVDASLAGAVLPLPRAAAVAVGGAAEEGEVSQEAGLPSFRGNSGPHSSWNTFFDKCFSRERKEFVYSIQCPCFNFHFLENYSIFIGSQLSKSF